MPPKLPNPAQIIGSLFSALGQYLEFQQIKSAFGILTNFLSALVTTTEDGLLGTAEVFTNVKESWHNMSGYMADTGGAIQGVAFDNWAMWHHLRYVLMPNTINYVWDWVWSNWIKQLREGLVATIGWSARWDWYQQGWINDNRSYTRDLQTTTRDYREKYVYPQIMFLLSPWRVAYWYAQEIATGIATYLNYSGHTETRDTISRVVYSDMSRLWQSFDKHLAEWLMTDVQSPGYGSVVPGFPAGSSAQMPPLPPSVWEPFVNEPTEKPYPAGAPEMPAVDWKY